MHELSKDNLLRSWKDISAYLGCDVRTCHRWEASHGMPVHRAEGGERKSPVFAYKDELDAWFRETFRNSHPNGEKAASRAAPGRPGSLGSRRSSSWPGPSSSTGGSASGASRPVSRSRAQSSSSRTSPGASSGASTLGSTTSRPTPTTMTYFQVIHKNSGNILPVIAIRDIDADGDREVLFALRRQSDQTGEGLLYCFDRKGEKRWEFKAGGPLVCGGRVYPPGLPHRRVRRPRPRRRRQARDHGGVLPRARLALPPGRPRLREEAPGRVLARRLSAGARLSRHRRRRPRGAHRRRGQQPVPGRLDRRVRYPRPSAAARPSPGEFACAGVGPGSELYYVTTPYLDVSETVGHYVCGFQSVDITESRWIHATTAEGLIFDFGFDLSCLQVGWGHGYRLRHEAGVGGGQDHQRPRRLLPADGHGRRPLLERHGLRGRTDPGPALTVPALTPIR
ncbi:MAG: hypothetical protein MZV70_70615 [Desulfobacterales bacterium]|nr:hypothetical protein [Desulfobacterales bacterium]